ncbi:MAG: tetratricopeptide repeat protein [Myxococcota bacterium]
MEGVPALFDPDADHAKAVTYDGLRTARGLNSKGLKLHKARNYAGASALYIKALEQNPLHIAARYNLACAFALQGDNARAIGLLHQLKALDCGQCRISLGAASHDKDFDALRENAAFQATVSGEHEVDVEALKKITKLIHTRLATFAGYEQLHSYDDLNALIHPKHPALALMWGNGEGSYGPAMEAIHQGGELFFVQSREMMNVSKRNGNPDTMTCRKTCCTLKSVPGTSERILQKACYWVTSEGDIYLNTIVMRQD